MSLTGERLRQLLRSSSFNPKHRKMSAAASAAAAAAAETPGSEAAVPTGCLTTGQNGGEGGTRQRNNGEEADDDVTSMTSPNAATYTACVTDDLAFRRMERQRLPEGVKAPRSASLNVYVYDGDSTRPMCRKRGPWTGSGLKTTSKREAPAAFRKRRSAARDHVTNGGDREAPEIPPKPRRLPQSPPSIIFSETRRNRDATSVEGRTSPGTREPPPLPLPPRMNRPRRCTASPEIQTDTRVTSSEKQTTADRSENEAVVGMTIDDGQEDASRANDDDDDENPYEPIETRGSAATKSPSKPDRDAAGDVGAVEEEEDAAPHETDSVFDYRSYGLSPVARGSDSSDRSPRKRLGTSSSDGTLRGQDFLRPTGSSDYSAAAPMVRTEVALPRVRYSGYSTTDSSESGETATYEAIGGASRATPQGPAAAAAVEGRTTTTACCPEYDSVAEEEETTGTDCEWLVLRRNDVVIVETGEVRRPKQDEKTDFSPVDCWVDRLNNTSLSYDKDGNAVYIPTDKLKIYGDPNGEPWFYPLALSPREATLFLRTENRDGCFLVYRSQPGHSTSSSSSSSSSSYNLSLSRGNGDVMHYHILDAPQGGFQVEGHDRSFLNLSDLVEYFKRNKSSLATRLRRPLKEAALPITAGYHYDAKYELDRDRLSLTGSIIGKGNFGVVCAGLYRSTPVAVKVLQGTDASLDDEDDFIEEATVLMMLSHENVVRIVGVSCSSTPFFIVTEFVQHGNLKECLRTGRIPSGKPDIYFDVCVQMLAALCYLDSVGYVLHRDIAARNFLVADLRRVKLADFGRGRYVTDDTYQAPRTEKISIKWAAPEVLSDFRYSTKADVWAAGIAIWEVYSLGQRPYESLSAEQTAVYVTEGGRLARPTLCPEEVYACVRECWRRTAASRPSASSLQQTILENRRAAIYRRNLKMLDEVANSHMTTIMTPKSKSPLTPTLKKKNLYNNSSSGNNNNSDSGKQRLSAIRDALATNSVREGRSIVKKSDSHELLPTSSSSENMSSLSSTPDTTTTMMTTTKGQKIRNSFRKLIINKKTRSNSKSKADYHLITSEESPVARNGDL